MKDVIAAIAPNDSVERFEGFGVKVLQGAACFTGPDTIQVGDETVKAKYTVVATGSHAFVPPIEGISAHDVLTNENVFDLNEIPKHLIVIGGGPIGCELAQAFRQLGAEVTVLEAFTILPKDDPDMADQVRTRLLEDGVVLHEGVKVRRIEGDAGAPSVIVEDSDGNAHTIDGSHILVAAGRRATVQGLGLEHAGVNFSPRGIEVDQRLRTSNPRIFAIGDVAGGMQFTHVAGYHAGIVIRNALFKLPAKAKTHHVPWVTYTDPELAHVGMTEVQAREKFGDKAPNKIRVLTWDFAENDRAQAERDTEGSLKAIVTKRGKILGCTIVGAQAGELIQPWVLALEQGLKIGALASTVAPYPTRGEISKRAAGSFYTASLFGERTRKIVQFLMRFS
ncbi:dihydrolipoyl dehydrogenase family protein [Pseudomonadota bacterium]